MGNAYNRFLAVVLVGVTHGVERRQSQTSRKYNTDRKEITTKDVFVNRFQSVYNKLRNDYLIKYRTCISVLKFKKTNTLRRQGHKGVKDERPWLVSYIIRGLTKSGTYLLSAMDGLALKSGINGVNLKEWQEAPADKMVKFTD
ncbi:uncharacterized protein LOC121368158 [Gigantopelta aegis]|uniref:uncharacterized protein LOC121368158 n=1 Tax=Gigantopelta aegis TaxID=1735272 RepID=UPI001B88772D|nr:uncharacterized protein LOC121368158 [Gigantopelta aegis]